MYRRKRNEEKGIRYIGRRSKRECKGGRGMKRKG